MRTIGWKFYLVFICITSVALVWAIFEVKETKGLPLEEIAALFGEQDQVKVLAANIHVDHTNHEVVVEEVGDTDNVEKVHAKTIEGKTVVEV